MQKISVYCRMSLPNLKEKGQLPEVAEQEASEPHHQGISRSPMEVQVEVKVATQVLEELRQKKRNGKKTSKS